MRKITLVSLFLIWLFLSIPVVHAEMLNLVTDANGNLISGDGLYREYNSLNQLVNVRNGSDSSAPLLQQFVYNPIEERIDVKKTFNNSGTVVETVYYWTKSFVTVENLTGQYNFTYVYHDGQLIAQELQGTRLFIHGNHEGSSSVITNSTGQIVERTEYDAYGNIISGGTKTRFGYENKEADSVVGDTDFNFRKYKSEWGLFTQPDTLIQNVYDPQSLNRYMFERGNPYKNTDETGHDLGLTAIAIFLIVLVLGAELAYPLSKPLDSKGDTLSGVDAVTNGYDLEEISTYNHDLGYQEIGYTSSTSRVPNPYGSKGSPAHQNKAIEIAKSIEARGLIPQREYTIKDPDTGKTRRADVVGIDPKTGKVIEIHQIGRQTGSGQPVSRERNAMNDIETATKKQPNKYESTKVNYHIYNKKSVKKG